MSRSMWPMGQAIKSAAFTLHPLNWRRGSAIRRHSGLSADARWQRQADIVSRRRAAGDHRRAREALPIMKLHAMAGLGTPLSRTARARPVCTASDARIAIAA